MDKGSYVSTYIEPMMIALDERIKSVKYRHTGSVEFVDIVYGFGQKMHICVTADSLAQMAIDVVKAVIL